MEQTNRPPIEANITPNDGIGVHLNREADGSITLFTLGKIESNGKTSRNREILITLHPPILESSAPDDKADFQSQLSKHAKESFRRHSRSSERRIDDAKKPDAVTDIR